jgi:ubiquinone/menaquinone biosynthesis C-methylase UbiE
VHAELTTTYTGIIHKRYQVVGTDGSPVCVEMQNSSSIEFDKKAAEEYDGQDHVKVFSDAVLNVLNSWDWYASATNLKILDFGCGTGRTSMELAQRGHFVTGADVSSDMLDQFRLKLMNNPSLQEQIRLLHARAGDGSDIADFSCYDVVFITFVLHHISADQRHNVITNLAKCLKDGGRLVVIEFDDTERSRASFAAFHDNEEQHAHHHGHSENHSKDGHYEEEHHSDCHSHGHGRKHDWLDRKVVTSWMAEAGMNSPVNQLFEIQFKDRIFDCYHITGTR